MTRKRTKTKIKKAKTKIKKKKQGVNTPCQSWLRKKSKRRFLFGSPIFMNPSQVKINLAKNIAFEGSRRGGFILRKSLVSVHGGKFGRDLGT